MTTIDSWSGEDLRISRDTIIRAWIVIARHSTRRGPSAGGTRMKRYPSVDAAVVDALRLSEGMTRKNAVAGLPLGGGKAVIAVPEDLSPADRDGLLLRYAARVEELDGRFITGPDVGTAEPDMDLIGRVTSHVFCRSVAAGGGGTASRWTAAGVFHGMRAAVRHRLGRSDLTGTAVLVQGLGEVGAPLVDLVVGAGATVSGTDVDAGRREAVRARHPGTTIVEPDSVIGWSGDVYAPCALGATLNEATIPALRVSVVAGAANNQLAEPSDAERLRARGILYAPDFVINAGGIIRAAGTEQLGWSDDEIDVRIAAIAATLDRIFTLADTDGITTADAADRLATEAMLATRTPEQVVA
jgi:glutamate dehydrogenase/leucine dehydrogenase